MFHFTIITYPRRKSLIKSISLASANLKNNFDTILVHCASSIPGNGPSSVAPSRQLDRLIGGSLSKGPRNLIRLIPLKLIPLFVFQN